MMRQMSLPNCRRIALCTMLFFSSLAFPALGGDMDFHVPDAQFKPIEPPAWVYENPMIAYGLESDIPAALGSGVQVFHTSAGWPYYPLRSEYNAPGYTPAEKAALTSCVTKIHAGGARLIGGTWPFAAPAHARANPEWLVHPEDNTLIETQARAIPDDFYSNLNLRTMCPISSPWREYLPDLLAEVVRDYNLDGFSFDGGYHPPICYCSYCKAQYLADTGKAIPKRVDLNNIEYRIYLVWLGDRLESFYRGIQDHIKAVNPEAVLELWTVNAGRYGHLVGTPRAMSRRMNLLIDCPMQEWWLDEQNLGSTVAPYFGAAYIRACTGQRPAIAEPYMMSRNNPYGTYSFPRLEAITRDLLVFSTGAFSATCFDWPNLGPAASKAELAAVSDRQPWFKRAKEMPWAAMLFSEQTRQFYGLYDIQGRVLGHAFGAYRAASENHIPFNLITEWDLQPERLAQYKVLVMPNIACLDAAQVSAIKDYVHNGGGLVASYRTSTCDEIGRPAVTAAPTATPTPPPGQLLQNPGFEEGTNQVPASWTCLGNADRRNNDALTGDWAGHMTEASESVLHQVITVQPNTSYVASVKIKTGSLPVNYQTVLFVYGLQTSTYLVGDTASQSPPESFGWRQYGAVFNSGANTSVIYEVCLRGQGATAPHGEIYVDDAWLFPGFQMPAPPAALADFALRDLFGVTVKGEASGAGYLDWRTGQAQNTALTAGDALLDDVTPDKWCLFKGKWLSISEPTGGMQVAARIDTTMSGAGKPAIVMGQYGTGRVVYMAAALDDAYYNNWLPYQGEIFKNAIEWAAKDKPPISVEAPKCIQSTFFQQTTPAGERMIVQLFNGINSAGNHGNSSLEVPLRTESVPVGGIKVHFRGLNIESWHLEPGGVELTARMEGADQVVSVPPVEIHSMLVAELRSLRVTNVNRVGYEVDILNAGKKLYGDRAYAFLPPVAASVQDRVYIRTLNADKALTATDFLSFDVNVPVTIYLALDDRITTPPAWMSSWQKLATKFQTSDSNPGRVLCARDFAAGKITLGANRDASMSSIASMYNVILVPQNSASMVSSRVWGEF